RKVYLDNILLSSNITLWAWSRSNEKDINVIAVPTSGSRERVPFANRKSVHRASRRTGTGRANINSKRDNGLAEGQGVEPTVLTHRSEFCRLLAATSIALPFIDAGNEPLSRRSHYPHRVLLHWLDRFRQFSAYCVRKFLHPLLLAARIHVHYLALLFKAVQHRIDRCQWILVFIECADLFQFIFDFRRGHGQGVRIDSAQNVLCNAAVQRIFQTLRGVLFPIRTFSRFLTENRKSIHRFSQREDAGRGLFLNLQKTFKLLHRRFERLAIILVSHCSNLFSVDFRCTLARS